MSSAKSSPSGRRFNVPPLGLFSYGNVFGASADLIADAVPGTFNDIPFDNVFDSVNFQNTLDNTAKYIGKEELKVLVSSSGTFNNTDVAAQVYGFRFAVNGSPIGQEFGFGIHAAGFSFISRSEIVTVVENDIISVQFNSDVASGTSTYIGGQFLGSAA